MRSSNRRSDGFFWDMLAFERLLTGPLIRFVYWAGLGVIVLIGFSIAGASVGIAMKEASLFGILLAFPVLVAGVLVVAALTLLWRSFCEFYVAILRISEDLRAIRTRQEAERSRVPAGATRAPPVDTHAPF